MSDHEHVWRVISHGNILGGGSFEDRVCEVCGASRTETAGIEPVTPEQREAARVLVHGAIAIVAEREPLVDLTAPVSIPVDIVGTDEERQAFREDVEAFRAALDGTIKSVHEHVWREVELKNPIDGKSLAAYACECGEKRIGIV